MLGLWGEGGIRWRRLEGDWSSGFEGLWGGVVSNFLSLSFCLLWGVLERGGELMGD